MVTGWLSDLLVQLHAERVDMHSDRMKEMVKTVQLGQHILLLLGVLLGAVSCRLKLVC